MVAVDTNVVVRLLANDHPAQVAQAAALFRAGPVFVAKSVLLETEWVLRYSYGLGRVPIARAFRGLVGLPAVTVEDASTVLAAITMTEHGIDFADALHIASAAEASRFVTFDRSLVKRAGKIARMPVVLA